MSATLTLLNQIVLQRPFFRWTRSAVFPWLCLPFNQPTGYASQHIWCLSQARI